MPEVATGLHFPTSVAVGGDGELFVAESGLPFGGAPPGGRVWRLDDGGGHHLLVDGLSPPVNGLTWFEGSLLVSEGGAGRILRLELDGSTSTVVEGLPGPGDYQVNMAVGGPDGMVYFSQGSMTNTAVVGLDSLQLGWLARIPDAHDIPGLDVVLAGFEASTDDPRDGGRGAVRTGAFCPFGVPGPRGREVGGEVPCTAAVMRCQPDGSGLELVGSPWPGQLVVTLFGDEAPMTAPTGPRVGRSVVRVDPTDWSIHPLRLPRPLLHRPIDVAWDPLGRALLVLDFGRCEMEAAAGVVAEAGSGALWRFPMDERGEC